MLETEDKLKGIDKNIEGGESSNFSGETKRSLFGILMSKITKKSNPEKYFQYNLEKKEFEKLKTLVEDSDGIMSWKKLAERGVVKIEGKKVEGIYWKGDLDLKQTKIKTLWKLKKVGGNLNCDCVETLEDLGELEEVEKGLGLIRTKIKTLGKLKKVGLSLDCRHLAQLRDLGSLEEVGGSILLKWTKIETLGKLKNIGENLYCEGSKRLVSLGELEEVWGYIYINWAEILEDVGELKYVGGNMGILGIPYISYMDIFIKIRSGKLKIQGKLNYYETLSEMYRNGEIDYNEFRKIYGDDIKQIEDESIRKQAEIILIMEYNIIREELKEKVDKMKEDNEGKNLSDEEKRELRKQIRELGRNLKKQKLEIENYGLDLGDL